MYDSIGQTYEGDADSPLSVPLPGSVEALKAQLGRQPQPSEIERAAEQVRNSGGNPGKVSSP